MAPGASAELRVAMAAECAAEQGAFKAFHRAAFSSSEILHYRDGWLRIAEDARVADMEALAECVESLRHEATVWKHRGEARAEGFRGTPSMLRNGRAIIGPGGGSGCTDAST